MYSPGRDVLGKAVDFMKSEGVVYSEARYHRLELFEIIAQNGKLMNVGMDVREGFAVRVFYRGSMGFASSPGVSSSSLFSAAKRAVSQAKATPSKLSPGYKLSSDRLGYARVIVDAKKPFDSLSLEEKLDLIVRRIHDVVSSSLREAKLASLSVHYTELLEEKEVVNSDGGWVYSVTPRVGLNILITIYHPSKGTLQRWLELGGVGGLELLKEWNVEGMLANEVSRLEKVLLEGVEPPKEKVPVILGSEMVGLIVHESAGHPMEADRILGREAAQAGLSFVKPDMVGVYRIGNEQATVIDDPTIPGSFGFYLYDDETVPARPRYIYREGLINEPLQARWTAPHFNTSSNAAARALDYASEPIIRMANTYLEPGDWRFEELLEEARNGIYIHTYMEWNIDDVRWSQRYVGLEAYLVEKGELGKPVRNPVIQFTTREFYSSIRAKSRNLRFYAAFCGKGEPMQGIPVWFGGPEVLLEPMRVEVAPE